MNKKLILIALIPAFIFVACKKDNPGTNKAVVESYLIPGQPVSVKVSQEISYGIDTVHHPITNLDLNIFYKGASYHLIETNDGVYTNNTIPIIVGEQYQLKFNYNNTEVSAVTKIPTKPLNFKESDTVFTVPNFIPGGGGPLPIFPPPVKLSWDNPNADYHLVVVSNLETNPVIIFNDSTGQRPIFRTAPAQIDTAQLSLFQFSYLGKHAVVLCHIWSEYQALYQSNGTNSTNLSEPPTNVTNGRGIFTGVATDTLFINVKR